MKKIFMTAILIGAFSTAAVFGQSKKVPSNSYFIPTFRTGEKFATIFSRTIAVTSGDFPSVVRRISGTGNYTVTDNNDQTTKFDALFVYDGRPEDRSKVSFLDSGKTISYNGKLLSNTDASGLSYNPRLWGTAPKEIKPGVSWETKIDSAWELGGAGSQKITVLSIDPVNHAVTLKREGDGEGALAYDEKEMDIVRNGNKIRVKITPGKTHWVGYTIFKNGIVISDELMMTRALTLSYEEQRFTAKQRQYILLNQMAE